MKKRSINGNHINMIKGRLGGEGIDSDAALWPAMCTSNMLMNCAAKTEVGQADGGHVRGGGLVGFKGSDTPTQQQKRQSD